MKEELQLFKITGKRTDSLELLYNALNTIKPTSVENESFLCPEALLQKSETECRIKLLML